MKVKLGGLALIAGAALLSLSLPAHGQYGPYTGPALHNAEGVTVQFTGGYQAVDWGIGGVNAGAGIYSALISPGIPVSPVNPAGIICDDFNDEIYTNETWGATAYQVSTLGSTTPITDVLFGGANSPAYANIGVAGYAAIAYLVEELHNPGNTATQDGDISAAIWSISDPGLTGVDANAAALALQAKNYASGDGYNMSQYSNLWVLTPILGDQPNGDGPPQEMWIEVPEGGAALLYLLLAGGVCFGAMFLNRRNRFANFASA